MHGNWVSQTLSSAQHFLFKFPDGKRGNLVNNKELKDKDTNIIGLSRRMVFWFLLLESSERENVISVFVAGNLC